MMLAAKVLFTLLLIAGATWFFRRRLHATCAESVRLDLPPLTDVDDTPDDPIPFGRRTAWVAVRSADAQAVARALRLQATRPINWRTGLAAAALGHVFVTPPVGEWTLATGRHLPAIDQPEWESLMSTLSTTFEEAQYFATHDAVGLMAWGRYTRGDEIRAFARLGDAPDPIVDRGSRDAHEGAATDNAPAAPTDHGDPAAAVAGVAEHWSVNPLTLNQAYGHTGTGVAGTFPDNPGA